MSWKRDVEKRGGHSSQENERVGGCLNQNTGQQKPINIFSILFLSPEHKLPIQLSWHVCVCTCFNSWSIYSLKWGEHSQVYEELFVLDMQYTLLRSKTNEENKRNHLYFITTLFVCQLSMKDKRVVQEIPIFYIYK